MKTTLVLGAAVAPEKFANKAIRALRQHGHAVVALGVDDGIVADVPIQHDWATLPASVDTITLYLNPIRQRQYMDRILAARPRRVIFNPGTENPALIDQLRAAGIEPVIGCTLVMLATDRY